MAGPRTVISDLHPSKPVGFSAHVTSVEDRSNALMGPCAVVWIGLASLVAGCVHPGRADPTPEVRLTPLADRIRVELGGELFTEYFHRDVPKPYCHPLLGPGGTILTRRWPMQEVPGEDRDHPHHRGFWYAHGSVNGIDFWTEGPNRGRIVQDEILEIHSGRGMGCFRSRNRWLAADGRVVCTDERLLRFQTAPNGARILDFEITLLASHGEVTFGDTKEGTLAVRVAESMRVRPNKAHIGQPVGVILTSHGHRDTGAWGKRAVWCDYSGPVQNRTVGIAIFDHPANPRHPTWWHVRDYGLFAANPFGRHDFEQLPDPHAGDLRIPAQGRVTFRYRLYLHDGNAMEARVADQYAAWIRSHGGS